MKVKEAQAITGSMTRTSKMPGLSYSLPAWACKTGAKLRLVPGTPCHGCYALKGNYIRYPAIKKAQYYRLDSLDRGPWVTAMVAQIKDRSGSDGMTPGTFSLLITYAKFLKSVD